MFILLLLLKVKYMKEEYFKWYSPNLNREIEMLVLDILIPVILFPTSMGATMKIRTWV
jgi:esterase/lipase superfamily enzyme